MSQNKLKLLVYSNDPIFLNPFRPQVETNYHTQVVANSDMCQFLFSEWEPNAVLIDAASAGAETIAFLRGKSSYSKLGIIVISSGRNISEAEAFRCGCDYFMPEGTNFFQLDLRLNALKKRIFVNPQGDKITAAQPNLPSQKSHYEIGAISVLTNEFIVKVQGKTVPLSPTQFNLLVTFISNQDQLLTREWIRNQVWRDTEIAQRSIDAQISKLKRLIPDLNEYLVNIYGKGYVMTLTNHVAKAA